MKKIGSIQLLCTIVSCCFVVISCSDDASHHASGDKKYHPVLHFDAASKYYYTISSETKTKLQANDQQIETVSNTDVGMICEIHKDSAGRRQLTLTYDTFHIVSGRNGDTKEISSRASSYDPVEKLLGNLKGTSLIVTMDTQGHVKSITGSKEIMDKVMAGVSTQDGGAAKQVQELMAGFSGDGFMKNMDQLFNLFPDTAVYIGDTWIRKTSQSSDLPYELVSTYTLSSVSEGIAQVESASRISTGKQGRTKVMGYDVSMELSGEQSGEYKVEEKTGFVVQSRTEADIQGTMELMGKEVPVKISIIKKVAARKM